MTVTSWTGWTASGSAPAPVFLDGGVVRIEDTSSAANPRLRFPVKMAGGQRLRFKVDGRAPQGRGYLFADLIAPDRTETIAIKAFEGRRWQPLTLEVVCPGRYDQDMLVWLCIGSVLSDTGISEYRGWSIDGDLRGQIVTPYLQDGWAFDPASGGLRLMHGGSQVGLIRPGDSLTTYDEMQAAIDARYDQTRDADAVAYIARACPAAADAAKDIISDLFAALKTDGIYGSIEHLFLLAAPTPLAALTDAKNPNVRAQASGSVEFAPYVGVRSAGGSILTSYDMSTRTLYTQNDAHLLVDVLTGEPSASGDIGQLIAGARSLISGWDGTNFSGRINNASLITRAAATAVGFHAFCRASSSQVTSYLDGVASTVSSSSTAPNASPLTLLRSGSGISPRQISLASVGSNLTGTQIANFKSHWATYKAAMAALA